MVFYYLIPFPIVAGAPDNLSKLRPYVITTSVLLLAFGLVQSWRAEGSNDRVSTQVLSVLWLSAFVVLALILFPEPIANFLATSFGG